MSECVVRMEMPKDCFECSFGIIDDTGVWCNALAQQSSGQRDDCPIICALPENHGPLVDAYVVVDELNRYQKALEYEYESDAATAVDICQYKVECAVPTIVPAERSET